MTEVAAAQDWARRGNDASRWPNKMAVRERIALLLDPHTFVEDGLLATAPVCPTPPTTGLPLQLPRHPSSRGCA